MATLFEPKVDQSVRLVPGTDVHREYWLICDVHYNTADQTADFYIRHVLPFIRDDICEQPEEWRLRWGGLGYTPKRALQYPCTRDVIVVTVDMPPEHFEGSLIKTKPTDQRICAAAGGTAPTYDRLFNLWDDSPVADRFVIS